MPTLRINGQEVRLDDAFLDLSPEQQKAQVEQIAASLGSAPRQAKAPQRPQAAPQAQTPPPGDPGPTVSEMPSYDSPNGPAADPATDAWIAEQEAAYQQRLQGAEAQPQDAPAAADPARDKGSFLNSAMLGLGDTLSFGTLDEITAGLGTVIPGSKTSVWDGKSISEAYSENVADERRKLEEAQEDHLGGYVLGGLAGGLIPIAGAARAASMAKGTTKLGATMAAGTGYGAAYGFGSGEGSVVDRLDDAALGGVAGAVGGAILHPVGKGVAKVSRPVLDKLMPKLAQARFAAEQADNPFAAVDAGIADDLDKLIQTVSASKGKKKLKEARISGLVSDLEQSYLPTEEIKALDLAPSIKQRLRAAMAQRHLLSDEEVAALADGTPAGDAVSAAIGKARRLRALVPDGAGSGGTAKRVIGEAVGSAAGWKLGGPIGGAAGSVLGRLATAGAASETATAARELAAQAPRFAQLPEVATGRTQAQVARDALRKLSDEARDAPFFAKREADAAKAQAADDAARMAKEGKRISIANAKDDIVGDGGFRAFTYERTGLLPSQQDAGALRLLKEGTITPEQFNAFLAEPDKLMAGNAGNAIVDRLAAMAKKGALARDPKWTPRPKVPMSQGQPPAIYSAGEVAPQPWATEGGGMAIDIVAPASPTWKSSDQGITEAQRNFAKAYEAWSDELDKAAPDKEAINFLYDAKEKAGRILDAEIFQHGQQAQSGPAIRNVEAYRATASANQARVSSAIDALRSDSDLDDGAREILSTAVATIGNTSSRDKAQGIATDALDRLPEGLRDKARATLQPLVAQIRK